MGGLAGMNVGGNAAIDYRKVSNNTKAWWFMDAALRLNMFHCLGLCGTLFFNGYDGSLLNGLQSLPEWQEYFHHPSANTLGLMNSSGFLPGIPAGFAADYIGNYLGRKKVVWLGTSIMAVGAIVMGVATNAGIFCGGRVLIGFGTAMANTVAPTLLQEIAHPRYRAQVGGCYTAIYYIAAILSASVCLGCINLLGAKAWRIPVLLQLVGPIVTLLMTATAPESPRWLAKHGKSDQALAILAKYHANGLESDPLVQYEYAQILEALAEEQQNTQVKYSDFLKTPGNRRRLAITLIVACGTNWVGNGIISYYLSPILTQLGIGNAAMQLKILIGLQCWNLCISMTAAIYNDAIGRRPLWLTSTAVMLVSFIIVMSLSGTYAHTGHTVIGTATIPFLFLFYGGYDLAWTPLAYSYPVEILPFSLRTKGQAIFISTQTLAVAVNTWVNPVALAAIKWRYYGVYVGILAVMLVVIYFYFPETKGLTIEEIILVFDKENAEGIINVTHGDVMHREGEVTEVHEHDGDKK